MNKLLILFAIAVVSIGCISIDSSQYNLSQENLLTNSEKKECDLYYRTQPMIVQGEATIRVPPELAIINFSVETLANLASDSLQKNSESIQKAMDEIRNLGIEEKEISTSGLSIYPENESIYDKVTGLYTNVFKGYKVTNGINIRTQVLDKAGSIIDAAVRNGVNRVDNISFDARSDTKQKIKDQLIGDAVLDAKNKAELALKPLNMEIKSIKAVNLSNNTGMNRAFSNVYSQAAFDSPEMDAGTQVFANSQTISVSVSVTFLIGPI